MRLLASRFLSVESGKTKSGGQSHNRSYGCPPNLCASIPPVKSAGRNGLLIYALSQLINDKDIWVRLFAWASIEVPAWTRT